MGVVAVPFCVMSTGMLRVVDVLPTAVDPANGITEMNASACADDAARVEHNKNSQLVRRYPVARRAAVKGRGALEALRSR